MLAKQNGQWSKKAKEWINVPKNDQTWSIMCQKESKLFENDPKQSIDPL